MIENIGTSLINAINFSGSGLPVTRAEALPERLQRRGSDAADAQTSRAVVLVAHSWMWRMLRRCAISHSTFYGTSSSSSGVGGGGCGEFSTPLSSVIPPPFFFSFFPSLSFPNPREWPLVPWWQQRFASLKTGGVLRSTGLPVKDWEPRVNAAL